MNKKDFQIISWLIPPIKSNNIIYKYINELNINYLNININNKITIK